MGYFDVAYFALAYFNWPVALGLVARNRWRHGRTVGLYCVGIGSALEVTAFLVHWLEWHRLAGEPDRLYVWILPLCLSIGAGILVVAGVVRSYFTASS